MALDLLFERPPELHPLLNPVILHSLFDVCPHDLLATCRLVSKTWLQESLLTWRSTSTPRLRYSKSDNRIHMGKENDAKDIKKRKFSDTNNSFQEFLDLYEQECGVKPYRRFNLKWWDFGSSPGVNQSNPLQLQQDRFWQLVGGNVTSLRFHHCTFSDLTTFRKIIVQTCPNMRSLIFNDCGLLGPAGEQPESSPAQYTLPPCGEHVKLTSLSVSWGAPISELELLSHFPSLTSLTLELYKTFKFDKDFLPWLHAIKLIRQRDGSKLPITRFNVNCLEGLPISDSTDPAKYHELCCLLQELSIPLESIDIEFPCQLTVVKEIMSVTRESLRTIVAVEDKYPEGHTVSESQSPFNPPPSGPFPCKFPFGMELSKLQTLILSREFCGSMEFLQWTPNLERLQLATCSLRIPVTGKSTTMVSKTLETLMANVKLEKLKELWVAYTISELDVRRLGRWMPNVEILSMCLNDQNFPVVCQQWKDLTHLHTLCGKELNDKGITGVGVGGDEASSEEIRPNITMLKRLRCFQYNELTTCNLTNASVYEGFLKLPYLQTLNMSASTELDITLKALNALRAQIPVVRAGEGYNKKPWKTKPKLVPGLECDYFNCEHKYWHNVDD